MSWKIITSLHQAINNLIDNSGIQDKFRQPYWIEITTKQPDYIYYFGPFDSYVEAETMQSGYIEDLRAEKATAIAAKIKRCLPERLTIGAEAELF